MADPPLHIRSVCGLTVIKEFTYRGELEEFSSKYFFKAPAPTTNQGWDTLTDHVVGLEKPIYPATVSFVRAYGYLNNDPHGAAVYSRDWSVTPPPPTGTYVPAAQAHMMAGDQAAVVEWKTYRKNSAGKWVYLRKYIHGGVVDSLNPDILSGSYRDALITYADTIGVGGVAGGITSGSTDDTIQSIIVPWNVTTRTLKRRGKRPLART